jgi:ACS family hexuronate transporter-like MFS transporter
MIIKNLSTNFDYIIAYNTVFIGYGLIPLIGLAVVLFLTGPLVQNKDLQDYVYNEIE